MAIPVSYGSGQASVASEKVGNNDYQQIKVIGGETGSTSVWGIMPDGSAKVSVIGTPNVNVSGSVFATFSGAGSVITVFKSSSIIGVVTGSVVAIPTGNQSISGTIDIGDISQSVFGASVIGWIPIQASDTSVLTIWQSPSIVGTYAEDVAHATGNKGMFALGVRGDTMASVTSADLDYSQISIGPIGEVLTANAPITKWVRGTADLRVVLGASVTAIPAQGASIFTYITSIQLANMGSASVLVTLAGGLGSILGYSIAPAGGGSNILYPNALKTGENSAFTASISGVASVLVSAQGFISKT